jgi:uracil phosphoribosyltransferase
MRPLTAAHPAHRVLDHPLAAHHLAVLRDRRSGPEQFRAAARRISALLAVEAARALPTVTGAVDTPVAAAPVATVAAWPLLVPILRAGAGLLDGVLDIVPGAPVAFVGLRRDETTLQAACYADTIPAALDGAAVWVLDPMVATGGSMAAAARMAAARGAGPATALCVLAAPEGLARLADEAPTLSVICAAVDDHLDERGFIVPGLGDAGDRLYGTL